MKKILFGSLVGLALIAFTGCTDGKDAEVSSKCQGDKSMAKKCGDAKAASKKCGS
ncbi:hypothetical protein [Sulfurovum riftiae]|uniref:hypothetical protein n=1 Tax=Sulfurovum riftiae TaxID=1630136 RepID=UPI000ABE1C4B|nr:hypothetical protein [Sulfurovum riftiae]